MATSVIAGQDTASKARQPRPLNFVSIGAGVSPLSDAQRTLNRNQFKVRAKVEYSIGAIMRLFSFTMVRYRGIRKNAKRLFVTAALTNLFMVHHRLMRLRQGRFA